MKKILYTGGTFDMFHYGHIEFLKKCRETGAIVVVALNGDEFAAEYKRKPVMSYYERHAALLGCSYVDVVVKNVGGKDSSKSILVVEPDIIAVGSDWKTKDYLGQLGITQDFIDKKHIELVYFDYTPLISSTEIIKRIKS